MFTARAPVKTVVSDGAWAITFASGRAEFGKGAEKTLEELFSQLVIAGGTVVELHGHTDDSGEPRANQKLSEARAFAVKTWMETKSPANFPAGRIRVFAHGQANPLVPNGTPEGRAQNRRVQVVLGMTKPN